MEEKQWKKALLDSTELYGLWANLLVDSLSKYVLKHFLNTAEDDEVMTILNSALTLSDTPINFITLLFNKEGIIIPKGFLEDDVNAEPTRLFTDVYYLYYLKNMATAGLANL